MARNKVQYAIEVTRYVYLGVLFTLLSGLFYYIINPGEPIDNMVSGVATIFLGLGGGVLLYKGILSRKRRGMYMTMGYGLLALSLYLIFLISGNT